MTDHFAARKPKYNFTRREALRSISAAALLAGLGMPPASAQMAQGHREVRPGTPPLAGLRVIERSNLLAGRLAGLLLADQGAEVLVERSGPTPAGDQGVALDDAYFDRGKIVLPPGAIGNTDSADVVIIDGMADTTRAPHQVLVRMVAALPGDAAYGELPPDVSEDILKALVGFYTDMSISGAILGRSVIYTPLPLPSVYCGVTTAIATVAALVDRQRTGLGREIVSSRLAAALSAVGGLTITSKGLPEFLEATAIGGVPPGATPEQFRGFVADAIRDPARGAWLERRFAPFSTPYRAKDGRWILPMAGPNARLTRRLLEAMGLWDKALATGAVFVDVYDPANVGDRRRNLADGLALAFTYADPIADLLEQAFATRTAAEWERFLAANGSAASIIMSWEEWQQDADARAAGIFAQVPGSGTVQIGRTNWMRSAQPYAPLAARRKADAVPPRAAPPPAVTGRAPAKLPLEGYTVVDMTNVLAGPSSTRMFAELGASVTRVDVMDPQQPPSIHVLWSGENSVGKQSIILDRRVPEGLSAIQTIAYAADIVVANQMDDQLARHGVDAASLTQHNPRGIGLQITATRGELHGPRHNDKGYDPSIQGTTGLMLRFGGPDSPTFHGFASAVDYLCGYLGTLSGVIALYVRETRNDGTGDWAETSLCNAASLLQLLAQLPGSDAPPSARGQLATGRTPGERVYQLSDGWIFAAAPRDITKDLGGLSQAEALAWCTQQKIVAAPVQNLRELVARHRNAPTATVRFEMREKDGWATECFAPSWFAFDGAPQPRGTAPSRIGADGPAVLAAHGYSPQDVQQLIAKVAVGRTEWAKA